MNISALFDLTILPECPVALLSYGMFLLLQSNVDSLKQNSVCNFFFAIRMGRCSLPAATTVTWPPSISPPWTWATPSPSWRRTSFSRLVFYKEVDGTYLCLRIPTYAYVFLPTVESQPGKAARCMNILKTLAKVQCITVSRIQPFFCGYGSHFSVLNASGSKPTYYVKFVGTWYLLRPYL